MKPSHSLRLKEVEHKNINHLSGGQKQRAYIAMIVAQDTKYVLLDEPLNNLDMRYSVDMMLILQDLVKKLGKTVMIVLHDINFAATFSDHIIAMKDGKIIKEGTPDEIMDKGILDYVFDHEFCIAGVNGKKYCIYYQEFRGEYMKKIALVLSIVVGLVSLAGCQIVSDDKNYPETVTITQSVTKATSRDDENASKQTVTEVIPTNPKNVVVFDFGVLDIFRSYWNLETIEKNSDR